MKIDLKSVIILIISSGLSLGTPATLLAQQNASDSIYKGWTMQHLPACKKEYRNAPPLWVTVTGYDAEKDRSAKINKNYMIGEQINKQPFIVPKRSIVQLHPQSQALYEQMEANPAKKLSPNTLLGVRVLSTPPESKKLNENAMESVKKIANFRDHLRNKSIQPEFAKSGSRGYLKYGDLERVKEQKGYIFMLKKDSPLLKKISDDTGEEDVALELAQENGQYVVNHCCGNDGICRDFAIYKALNPKTGEEIKTKVSLEAECESCLANETIPMKKDFMAPLQGLVDVLNQEKRTRLSQFNFVDSRGFVQLPLGNSFVDNKETYKQGPFGSVKYSPETGDADTYLKPEVACGFSQLLKTWQDKHCPDDENSAKCRLEFGNASHAFFVGSTCNRKTTDEKCKDKRWESSTHSNGECIDIRPNYEIAAGGGRSFKNKNFDMKSFRNFMKLAEQLGPDTCLTSRDDISREFRKSANCSTDGHHDDHLHICFPRKNGTKLNEKLMNACLNGVK